MKSSAPEVGVDGEASRYVHAVEPAAQHGQLLGTAAGGIECPRPGELESAAGFGRGHGRLRGVGEHGPTGRRPPGVRELADRELRLAKGRGDQIDVALSRQPGADQGDVVPRGHLGITGHVPRGAAQRPGQGRLEAGDMVDHSGHRARVKPKLRVRQVLIVEQQDIRGLDAAERVQRSERARDVNLEQLPPYQRPAL